MQCPQLKHSGYIPGIPAFLGELILQSCFCVNIMKITSYGVNKEASEKRWQYKIGCRNKIYCDAFFIEDPENSSFILSNGYF